jgi:hypothetical protein
MKSEKQASYELLLENEQCPLDGSVFTKISSSNSLAKDFLQAVK